MIINIDNEAVRLDQAAAAKARREGRKYRKGVYCPFVVTIYRDRRSRRPIVVRRETLQQAMAFVEDVIGLSAIRYVTNESPGQLYAFTGTHKSRYSDTQYKPFQGRGASYERTRDRSLDQQ